MTSHPQNAKNQSSHAIPSPARPVDIFDLNQSRRAKVTNELQTLRSGTLSKWFELYSCEILTYTFLAAFLEWPTIEGLEAFAEKKTEYGEMMEDHVADLQTVLREQFVIVKRLERGAKLAEERRLQEFQRALESMGPVEAEAARRAERERAIRVQREYEARLAELDAEFARIDARVREEYPYDSDDE
jgi:hypothetical protein